MNRISLSTLTNQDIQTPLLVATCTATEVLQLMLNLSASGLVGNGTYRACLTKQINGAGAVNQSGTSYVPVAATVTTVYFPAMPLPLETGDVVKVYLQGLTGDSAVEVQVELWNVTPSADGDVTLAASQPNYAPAKAGDEMALIDDAITTAKVDTGVVVGTTPTAGAYTVTLTVEDANTTDPIPNVFVIVKNAADNATLDQNTTDNNGQVTFALNAATYTIHLALPPAYESQVATLVVAGNTTHTYSLVPITPGTPSSPDLCRVYGYEYLNGNPVANRAVQATLQNAPTGTSTIILENRQVATHSDEAGLWYFDLVIGFEYQIFISQANVNQTITVPNESSVNVRTLFA